MIGVEAMLANVDAGQLPKPLVKWSHEPACAQDVPRALSQAIQTASLPPRAPVYLSIPYDDWAQPAPAGVEHLAARQVSGAALPAPALLAELGERLSRSRNPVLVLGPDVDGRMPTAWPWNWRRSCGCRPGSRRRPRVVRSPPAMPASAACCRRPSPGSAGCWTATT